MARTFTYLGERLRLKQTHWARAFIADLSELTEKQG